MRFGLRQPVQCLAAGAASLAIGACASSTAHAQPDFEQHSTVKLVFEHDGVAPDATTKLALVFQLDDTYHTYAEAFNDTGAPLSVSWSLPEGVKVGDFHWPAPKRYVQAGGLLDHTYEESLVVTAPLSIDPDLQVGETLSIEASVEWLVCDDQQCIPQFAEVSGTLPVVSRIEPSEHAGVFRKHMNQLGELVTGAPGEPFTISWQGRTLIAESMSGQTLSFIPAKGSAVPEDLIKTGHSETGRLAVPFERGNDRVIGWIRVHETEGAARRTEQPTIWLLNLRVGEKPMKVIGETYGESSPLGNTPRTAIIETEKRNPPDDTDAGTNHGGS